MQLHYSKHAALWDRSRLAQKWALCSPSATQGLEDNPRKAPAPTAETAVPVSQGSRLTELHSNQV